MDIRSFFGKGGAKTTKRSAPSPVRSSTNRTKRRTAPDAEGRQCGSEENIPAKEKKQPEDDDSDATSDGGLAASKRSERIVDGQSNEDSDTTDGGLVASKSIASSEKKEADKQQQQQPPSTKKQRRSVVLSSSDDEDDYVGNAPDSQDDDDDDDEDFEMQSRSKRRKASAKSSPPRSSSRSRNVASKVNYTEGDTSDDTEQPDSQHSLVTASSAAPSFGRRSLPAEPLLHDHDPTSSPRASPTKPKLPTKAKKRPPLKPNDSIPSYPSAQATPGCLDGFTFVFTGVMSNLNREDAEDYVKGLGARVTTAVSGRTDYLLCGEQLEDGRPINDGSKYRKAMELGPDKIAILHGEGQLFALTKLLDEGETSANDLHDKHHSAHLIPQKVQSTNSTLAAPATATNPYAKKSSASGSSVADSNSKTSASTTNLCAKKNPYTNKTPSSSSTSLPLQAKSQANGGVVSVSHDNSLWTDKYAPSSSLDILGNQESVKKLRSWLDKWECTFNHSRAQGKSFGAPGGPWKAALLSGPPGIGKTTTAVLVANEAGREVLELNASDTRSKKGLSEGLGDVTGSQVLNFRPVNRNKSKKQVQPLAKRRCVIMDEVDGMGAGDRSGIAELIKMIKTSKVPIICICNDRQSQKVRSLVPYCLDLRYRRPVKTVIARRAVQIGAMEGMRVEQNAAETIAESCGNDVRQVLNCLQMWANKKHDVSGNTTDMTYQKVKERQGVINKDEILRVSMFDATKLIVEGSRGLANASPKAVTDSLYRRSDAFFIDYGLMGLNVHQNYLKVMTAQFQETKRSGDADAELTCLERMYKATESMSDFAVVEQAVRGGDMNWGLLPLCSILAVKTGHHIGGENGSYLPGFPEFAGWLGKNSSRGRVKRILQELAHHMNYKVSSDSKELRLRYFPALRQQFLDLMMDQDGARINEAIAMMDEYGLDRDDVFEHLNEFTLDSNAKKFSTLDSKTKASFTREYNKGVHKSQALVDEQGVTKTRKKATATEDLKDPDDVFDDDDVVIAVKDDDDNDEDEVEAIQQLFKKQGRGKSDSGKKSPSSNGRGKKST